MIIINFINFLSLPLAGLIGNLGGSCNVGEATGTRDREMLFLQRVRFTDRLRGPAARTQIPLAFVRAISCSFSSARCQAFQLSRVAFSSPLSYTCEHRVTEDLLFHWELV